MFCREQAAEFRPHQSALQAAGIRLVFISTGTPAMAADFVTRMPEMATVYVDQRRDTYRALGFVSSLASTLRWEVLKAGSRAVSKGFSQGATQGDPWQQGGVLVVAPPDSVLFQFASEYAGHHPPTDDVVAAALRGAGAAAAADAAPPSTPGS